MSFEHSPAEIIAQYLTDQGVFSATLTDDWALFVSHLPDKPSRSGVLYDASGTLDGRYMRNGTVRHQGLNLRVRGKSSDATVLEQKMRQAAELLATVQNATVMLGDASYSIRNVSRVSGMSSVGVSNSKLRNVWTTDFIVTLEEGAIAGNHLVDALGGNHLVDGLGGNHLTDGAPVVVYLHDDGVNSLANPDGDLLAG